MKTNNGIFVLSFFFICCCFLSTIATKANDEEVNERRELVGHSWVAPSDFDPSLATKISSSPALGSVYICSGGYSQGTAPGTYMYDASTGTGTCTLTWLGKTVTAQDPVYVLQAKLTSNNWVKRTSFQAGHAVVGGRVSGHRVYICKAMDPSTSTWVIGRFDPNIRSCVYPSNGNEFETISFKVLSNFNVLNPL
jgi:hypothetical protein